MKQIRVKKNMRIKTRNASGEENGYLVPIINVHDAFLETEQWPQQVYCTVIKPKSVKGPHLHMKRWGFFTCVKGDVRIVMKVDGEYQEHLTGESHDYASIQVPAGIPCALVNIGEDDAFVLNMPSPSWHKDDQDDWDVEFPGYRYF
jgi:dTDP-4-dehydrorhamnose 3,5-epimerase-like enzyme